MTRVDYRLLPWEDWLVPRIRQVVEETSPRAVADLGGGANPILPQSFVAEFGLKYSLLDISEEELAKAPPGYHQVVADVSSPDFEPSERFDLVVSRWFLEHVPTPAYLHRNVFEALSEDGRAVHFFPTLYALPFVANRVLPETVSSRLVTALFPDRAQAGRQGKFKAYYRWCRGPTKRQLRRFREIGYEIEQYVGFFGHRYLHRVPVLQAIDDRLARVLVKRPMPILTSYACIVLRKPASTA